MDSSTPMPDENTDANDISSATLPEPLESVDVQGANMTEKSRKSRGIEHYRKSLQGMP